MKTIDTNMLGNITGGAMGLTTGTTAPSRRSSSSSSNLQMQTALTGVTSALDSLKQNQNNNGGINQLLPIAMMAKWLQNR